jgi:hypothetical protein
MNIAMATLLIASGVATRYDPGVMKTAVDNQIGWGHVPPGTDPAKCVALFDCAYLGRSIWLERNQLVDGPYTVCDCAQAQHRGYLTEIGFGVDLSYKLAMELGLPMDNVLVWSVNPYRGGGVLQ